jgi:hypothetical protein
MKKELITRVMMSLGFSVAVAEMIVMMKVGAFSLHLLGFSLGAALMFVGMDIRYEDGDEH